MVLDTFNRRITVSFDGPTVITQVDPSKFLLQSETQSLSLEGSVVSIANRSFSLSYPKSIVSTVETLLKNGLKIVLRIPDGSYTVRTQILRAFGSFSVELLCMCPCTE